MEVWKLDNKSITPPIDSEALTIELMFTKGTLAESQPMLDFDKLSFSNDGLGALQNALEKYGRYQEIPLSYEFDNYKVFDSYLTDFNFRLDIDEIEAKPVVIDSTDAISEKLSALEMSLLNDKFRYSSVDFTIEKVNVNSEVLQLTFSSLMYSYILYSQLKEIYRLTVVRPTEAAGNASGLSFGTTLALVLEIVSQAVFVATTVVQLVNYAKQARELFFPKVRTKKTLSLYEIARASFEYIGYKFITDIDDMNDNYFWQSGNVNSKENYPRSSDVCGSGLNAINFIMKKYSARIFVRNKTVYITRYYSDLFYKANSNNYILGDFITGNYTENIDEMVGTREILYSIDPTDEWTSENFQGTEYKIRANIADPKKSTIKGYEQINYGVSLLNRKDTLNDLELAWESFTSIVNSVVKAFGGSNQNLKLKSRIGIAKISSDNLTNAKLFYMKNGKIPANHREKLSAKADEEKYHWVKSHVRNPRAKKRVYTDVTELYNLDSLSLNINSNVAYTRAGEIAEITSVKWDKSYDNAIMSFEVEDKNRVTNLIETFHEPTFK